MFLSHHSQQEENQEFLVCQELTKKNWKKKQQQSNQHNDELTSKRDKKQLGFCERLNGKNSMLFLQKNEKERNWTQWASDFMQIKKELPAMLKNQQWLCLTQIFREKAGSKKREKNISMIYR